jgi:hypothetical protein
MAPFSTFRAANSRHHGEDAIFQFNIEEIRTHDPALILLGEIVPSGGFTPHDPHPAGEGLRWIGSGFWRTWLSDIEILDR